MGFKAISLPTTLDEDGIHNWNYDTWEPLVGHRRRSRACHWPSISARRPKIPAGRATGPFQERSRAGPCLNYVETTFGGQRAATMLVTSRGLGPPPF